MPASKKKSAVPPKPTDSSNASAGVDWPALPTPAQRAYPIELDEILESQILLIHNFFSSKSCAAWLHFLSTSPQIQLSPSPAAKKGEAQRSNHRFSVEDPSFAQALWEQTGLRDLLAESRHAGTLKSSERPGAVPSGLNPNIRIYRYEPGQAFAPHYDDTVRVGKNHTEWTLLIYLSGSEDVQGGETAFYPCGIPPALRKKPPPAGQEDVLVQLQKGLALLHRHGRECLLHEGKPVLQGVKWILRSDVVLSVQ